MSPATLVPTTRIPTDPVPAAWSAMDHRWQLASRLLLAGVFVLIVFTYRDYGMTWDEEHSLTNGRYWIEWYESGFTQRGVIDDNNQRWRKKKFGSAEQHEEAPDDR